MDSSENIANIKKPNGPQDSLDSILLSDYATKLEAAVKRRYLEKMECIGIDPVLHRSRTSKQELLQPVESADILSYLVLETSYYIKEQFRN